MSNALILSFSILSTSFLGSWHCAAMCGPIASLMAQRKSLWSYHLGRLISYLVLGAIAGSLGQVFLNSQILIFRWVTAGLLASFLFYLALTNLFPKIFARPSQWPLFSRGIQKIHSHSFFRSTRSGWIFGGLTAFLPCGWLYTYVLAAMTTGNTFSGILVMGLFWLGGFPVLYAAPQIIKKIIAGTPDRHQRIAGFILLFASFYSVCIFMLGH